MCTKTYNFVAFGCIKIPNFVRGGKKFPFGADGREENEGMVKSGGKNGAWCFAPRPVFHNPIRESRRTVPPFLNMSQFQNR